MLTYTLYGLFILACIVLVVVILLQPGKSGAGDLFSSSVSSTAFGPRGTASILVEDHNWSGGRVHADCAHALFAGSDGFTISLAV